jgi:uncharacterized protein
MIVDLTNFEDLPRSFDLVLKPAELDFENEPAELIGEITAQVTIGKGIAQTEVAGEILAGVVLECSRCLKEVENSLKIPFKVSFVNVENFTDQSEHELDSDELEIDVIENDQIDLKELVREQILLALPARIFCREDCKGLCRICGGDKNLIDCKCEEKEVDPRWAALKNLKF